MMTIIRTWYRVNVGSLGGVFVFAIFNSKYALFQFRAFNPDRTDECDDLVDANDMGFYPDNAIDIFEVDGPPSNHRMMIEHSAEFPDLNGVRNV
jgi:hypothetical protein